MAVSIANNLGPLVADMTLGLRNKSLKMIIHKKTRFATSNHIMKDRSYSLTATIHDLLQEKPQDMAAIKNATTSKKKLSISASNA